MVLNINKGKIIHINEHQLSVIKESIDEVNDLYNSKRPDSSCPFMDKVYGNGFTLVEMLQYDDFSERVEYAAEHLPVIGYGKRRGVFVLNDKLALKLTLGEHRWQSKNEYDSALLLGNLSDLLPRILYEARDFSWCICERAEALTEAKCQKILGLTIYYNDEGEPSLQGFQLWAETQGRQKSRQSSWKMGYYEQDSHNHSYYMELYKKNPWFKKWVELERSQRADTEYGTDLSLGGGDFRAENLGVVKRGGKETVVLIDAGFVKPYDTRKLSQRYGIQSPTIGEL